MAKQGGKKHGVGEYIVIALILAAITYIEYYIVEFPLAWLGAGWTLFWLIALSVLKFWMVIWYFMHLKDDDRLYSTFFSSGMVIGMGTFVVLALLFLLPAAVSPVVAEARGGEAHGSSGYPSRALPAEVVDNIATDGASRPLAEQAAAPRPSDRTVQVAPPAAPGNGFAVALDDLTGTEAPAAVEASEAPVAEAPAPAAPAPISAQAVVAPLPGQALYGRCAGCHLPTGEGRAGVFPPLAGHVGDIFSVAGGREYMIDVLLYGLQGPINVRGNDYNGLMPGWASMSDTELADLIDYLVRGFEGVDPPADYQPIVPSEVAAQRGRGLSAAQVLEIRNALGPIGAPAPSEDEEPAAAEPAAEAPTASEPVAEAAPAEEPAPAAQEVAPAAATVPLPVIEWDRGLGERTYASCSGCHQATGAGIPGVFPPVAGHSADLYAAEGGRQYLIQVLLYGVQGPITVAGATYNGLMPGWASFSDQQIAAVINHIVAGFGETPEGFIPIEAPEVAAERSQSLPAAEVHRRRAALNLD
jgi:mono/diheme cytochrome c family protein